MIKKWLDKTRSVTVGPVISVSFPGLGLDSPVSAKIDTGAYTGALHASEISEVSGRQGQKWLEFRPLGQQQVVRMEAYESKLIKSSNGQSSVRFVIDTEIAVNGAIYPIRISLADRSQLKYPVLIGRKFLASHKFLIDLARKS